MSVEDILKEKNENERIEIIKKALLKIPGFLSLI